MKLIIFLLLLSGSCFGQEIKAPPLPEHMCFPKAKPMDLKKNQQGDTLIYDLTMYATAEQGVFRGVEVNDILNIKCSHRWVELHQDTVDAYDWYSNRSAILRRAVEKANESGREYFFEEMNLICLICHQEKKKVIHFKRDK